MEPLKNSYQNSNIPLLVGTPSITDAVEDPKSRQIMVALI